MTAATPNAARGHGKHRVHHAAAKAGLAVKPPADKSGQTRTGKASYYSQRSAGKKMASGARMDPNSNNAASRTLPLGTKARVTNTSNGSGSASRLITLAVTAVDTPVAVAEDGCVSTAFSSSVTPDQAVLSSGNSDEGGANAATLTTVCHQVR